MLKNSHTRGNMLKDDNVTFTCNLLYLSVKEPEWCTLHPQVKRELCRLTRIPYNSINSDVFSKHNREIWKSRGGDKKAEVIECPVCYDTFNLDGKDKVTTLMCGHSFCSKCIFRHMRTQHTASVCCPMCRTNVYNTEEARPPGIAIPGGRIVPRDKRLSRQKERWNKRQRAKGILVVGNVFVPTGTIRY